MLVAVDTRRAGERWPVESSMAELALLAKTAGAVVVGRLIQRLPAPSQTHYLGKGKIDELLSLKGSVNYDVVIFDDELSPRQQQNLEETLQVKVIDRAALILDIFARRARTREGQLQVELAQHQYLLPRLAGQWRHLERLGGGIGTRGPGESQLETDRRIIRQKIHRLEGQIEEVRRHRARHRQQRQKSGIPVVAIVGYTNAGKSTLLNALSQAGVFVEDKLFATLEELDEANILLHVVDLTSPSAPEQCQTVEGILADLNLMGKPQITVLNKIDLLLDKSKTWDEASAISYLSQREDISKDMVLISAGKGWGLKRLLEVINHRLTPAAHPV